MEAVITGLITVNYILMLTNICLHSLGLYLLICLHHRDGEDVQLIYIMNLSATELTVTVLYLIKLILLAVYGTVSPVMMKVDVYVHIITKTILAFNFYTSLLYIVIDKLLQVLLNITYPIYWSAKKTKYQLAGTWIIGLVIFICVIIPFQISGFDYNKFTRIFSLIFDIVFVFVAISSYSFIFYRYKQTRVNPAQRRGVPNPEQSIFRIFRNSRFFISVLLISSFLLFMVIPNLIYSFVLIKHISDELSFILIVPLLLIMYEISILCDALVYIFIQRNVRRLLWRKLRRMRFLRDNDRNSSQVKAVMERQSILVVPVLDAECVTSTTVC